MGRAKALGDVYDVGNSSRVGRQEINLRDSNALYAPLNPGVDNLLYPLFCDNCWIKPDVESSGYMALLLDSVDDRATARVRKCGDVLAEFIFLLLGRRQCIAGFELQN